MVVDRFTKYAHFLPLTSHYTSKNEAQVFFENIFKLHGLPNSIVSDRDKVLWQELFEKIGIGLHMSTAYHPQTDGQTERVNKCLESYLRCMCFLKPHKWKRCLAVAEWRYNTNFHTSLQMTPFKALYGYTPSELGLDSKTSVVAAVLNGWRKEDNGIHF